MDQKYRLTADERKFVDNWLLSRGLPTSVNVTFGDVALPERYSSIRSRSEITDFSAQLTDNIKLKVPVILANMVCVAGARSIVSIEENGGLGIPPQMLSIKNRLMMLEKIKRAHCALIDNPLTIGPGKTLAQAKALMKKHDIYSLVVVDDKRRPIGILSTRDWMYETNDQKLVARIMGGKRKLYVARKNISFEKAAKILRKHRIEKLPLVGTKGKLAGLITARGLFYKHHYPLATRDDHRGRFLRVGSVGVGRKFTLQHLEEVRAQVKMGICLLLVDTARAFSINTREAIRAVRKHFPKLKLMVGNVSTPEGAKFLFEEGVDMVKVGQGPGEACRTREVGVGIPQISAVAKCAALASYYNKQRGGCRTVIADGGVKNPGDIAKALVAGAAAIMSGRLFIGTEEAEAQSFFNEAGLRVKNYVGSASFQAQQERLRGGSLDKTRRPEGVEKKEIPVTGTIKDKVEDILDGLRSAMSYIGVKSVAELQATGQFELQTHAGLIEGTKKPIAR